MHYDMKVRLFCPVCRSSQFSEEGSSIICAHCKNSFTMDQLMKANDGRVNNQFNNLVENQIKPDLEKQIKTYFKKAFEGNPYIKLK